MKKFLAIALIAASFVACNEGEKKVEETVTTVDTAAAAVVATVDTAAAVIDTAAAKVGAAVDTLKK